MNQNDEFSFETDTISVEPPPHKSKYPSVSEFREIIGSPDRDEYQTQQASKVKTGTITKFADGIGFLFSDDGHGVVFTPSNSAGFHRLQTGQRVEFKIVRTEHGYEVNNVEPMTVA